MYLKVADSAPAAAPGVRAIPMPTVVTPDGVRRGMGYVLVAAHPRGMGLAKIPPPSNFPFKRAAGFGAVVKSVNRVYRSLGRLGGLRGLGASYDQTYGILAQDILATVNSPNGTLSPAQFQQNITADVMGVCSQLSAWNGVNGGDQQCPPDIKAQIADATASYQAWLGGQAYQPPPSFSSSNYASYGFANPPGYQTNPYSGQQEPIPNYQQPAAAAPAPAAAPSSPVASQSGKPLGVTLQNATGTSNTQFRVGDSFRLVVTGPANAQVTGSSQHDGKGGGAAPFGSTDASGTAIITGTMTPDTVGGWVEQWYVGGQSAGSVSFSVVAPAAAAPPPDTSKSSAGSGGSGSSSSTTPPPAGSTPGFDLSFLTQNAATVGGTSIPWWALLAAGGVALYAFSGSHGKR
jgi:hypothetical protein